VPGMRRLLSLAFPPTCISASSIASCPSTRRYQKMSRQRK
jgi:hypothetical protein